MKTKRSLLGFAVPLLAMLLAGPLGALAADDPTAGRPAGPVPPGVEAHRDIEYVKGGHGRQKLDLYVPEKGGGPFPVIVWIHGGGWANGHKAECRPLDKGFVPRGYAAVSIGYRLSGHAIFPAQLEDCKAAVRWLRAHARQYRLDPARIGAWGASAGGHLGTLLGTTGDVREFDVGDHLDQSSRVQAVCDYFGPTDFLQMDAHAQPDAKLRHNAPTSPPSKLIGGPIQDPASRGKVMRANPINYVTRDDAPFLIVHGNADPSVAHHQSELLHRALVEAGVPSHFVTVDGGKHGGLFPHAVLDPLVRDFFDRHLKGDTMAARWPVVLTSGVKATPP